MKPLYLYIAGALTALTLAEAASAQTVRVADTDQTRVATVHYADLNLSSREGVKSLVRRVRQATDAVCGGQPSLANLEGQAGYRACVVQAWDSAMGQLNLPPVTTAELSAPRDQAVR